MNLDLLEKICAKGRITHKKVLAKSKVVVLLDLLHCLLHLFLKFDGGTISLQGELLIVHFHSDISSN
jgi:hypothetical protein